jgi:hypothetical protein
MILSDKYKTQSLLKVVRKMYSVSYLLFPLVSGFIFVPGIARACAVCFTGKEESLEAFYVTTIFLTLLPAVMLASIGFWLYRQYRKTS